MKLETKYLRGYKMQSKKRFIETSNWDEPFFMELTPKQKLCWFFINDRCDNIGVWTPNPKLLAFILDIEDNPRQFAEDFLQAINNYGELILITPSGDWLLKHFVKFQFCKKKPLSVTSTATKSYLDLMVEKKLLTWFRENYPETLPESYLMDDFETPSRPLIEPSETHKEKDKEKDMDKDKERDKEKGMERDKDKEKAQEREFLNGTGLKPFNDLTP